MAMDLGWLVHLEPTVDLHLDASLQLQQILQMGMDRAVQHELLQ